MELFLDQITLEVDRNRFQNDLDKSQKQEFERVKINIESTIDERSQNVYF